MCMNLQLLNADVTTAVNPSNVRLASLKKTRPIDNATQAGSARVCQRRQLGILGRLRMQRQNEPAKYTERRTTVKPVRSGRLLQAPRRLAGPPRVCFANKP